MMKFFLSVLLITSTYVAFSQNNPRPSRSRFWNSKISTFSIKPGDILVYSISNGGTSNLVVTVNNYGNTINYDYNSSEKNLKGNVTLQANTVDKGSKYQTNYTTSGANPSFWLSKTNYKDIETEKQTKIDVGNGMETFVRSNNSTMKINYKGKQKIITLYNIVNQDTANRKKIGILNDAKNPLIVNLSNGDTITLKEVR
jgi:hypothetical protein